MATPPPHVRGVIYYIACIHPEVKGKAHIGQTRTHILNHGKYRPFGAEKRWLQHVSEAKCNLPTRQSWKLNNAIRKYGIKWFIYDTISICNLDDLDTYEIRNIETWDSIRHGYNIQRGGNACAKNTEEMCAKTAATLKTFNDDRRRDKFAGAEVIGVRLVRLETKGVRAYVVMEGGLERYTSFYGRRSTLADSYERAWSFALPLVGGVAEKITVSDGLRQLLPQEDRQDNQIAGTPSSLCYQAVAAM